MTGTPTTPRTASNRIANCGREPAGRSRAVIKSVTLSSGNPMRAVLLAILIFEVVAFSLAIPVMIRISQVSLGLAVGLGGGAALLALLAAGLLRSPAGYLVGWSVQLIGLVLGFLTTPMFFVGGMFLALWLLTFILGKRLDRPAVA
jgi:hypothetical protein